MTRVEAIAYFIDSNERIISVAKDENRYNYETQQIEDVFMRKDFEAKDIAIKALEQEPIHDILDKIRVEITDWQNDIHDNEYDAEKHDFVFERIFEIFDEYRERDE